MEDGDSKVSFSRQSPSKIYKHHMKLIPYASLSWQIARRIPNEKSDYACINGRQGTSYLIIITQYFICRIMCVYTSRSYFQAVVTTCKKGSERSDFTPHSSNKPKVLFKEEPKTSYVSLYNGFLDISSFFIALT